MTHRRWLPAVLSTTLRVIAGTACGSGSSGQGSLTSGPMVQAALPRRVGTRVGYRAEAPVRGEMRYWDGSCRAADLTQHRC